jgi:nucleotide-binding universal stress UspA family protein
MGKIVVGVDGSDRAKRALEWAIEEARLRDAVVEAVYAWSYPYVGTIPSAMVIDFEQVEANARDTLEAAVGQVDAGDIAVEHALVHGGAAQALVERGQDADLVVVGSRGLGGFTGLLLGSVSHQVTHHAPCPVVVVPHEE